MLPGNNLARPSNQSYYPRPMKQCFRCKKAQDYSCFAKDGRKKDGYRASCKTCLKMVRVSPRIVSTPGFVKVPVSRIDDATDGQESIFDKLYKKLHTHYSISVNDGFARIQAHYNGYTKTWKGANTKDVLEKVLA